MSGQCSIWAWAQVDRCESASQFLVLLKLADMAHDDGKVWPSHAYLAKKTKLSERTVRAAISAMDGTLLRTVPRAGKTDIIWLSLTSVTIEPTTREEMEAGPRGRPKKTPANDAQPRQITTATPAPVADEPQIEPSNQNKRAIALVASTGDQSEAKQAFDAYNALAEDLISSLKANGREPLAATARKLNDVRRRSLNARLKEVGGIEGWRLVLQIVRESAFLNGSTRHQFGLNLDFLLQPSSFTKLIEGFYSKDKNNVSDHHAPRDRQRAENFEQGAHDAYHKLRERRGLRA